MNEAMVISGNPALVVETAGDERTALGQAASGIERRALDMTVSDDLTFQAASELTKRVKAMQKKVKDYWEPVRRSAKSAYDEVLGKKKEMLTPLENAESVLKRKMGDYAMARKREAEELEERRRREAEEAAREKLDEAIEAESRGDADGADYAMAEAEVYDACAAIRQEAATPKAEGVSMSKTWKITSLNPAEVPIRFHGAELRPVDEKAVLRLIKATGGTISIPGVAYAEDVSVSVRV